MIFHTPRGPKLDKRHTDSEASDGELKRLKLPSTLQYHDRLDSPVSVAHDALRVNRPSSLNASVTRASVRYAAFR